MVCICTGLYVLYVVMLLLDKSNSRNSTVEVPLCNKPQDCTGCYYQLSSGYTKGIYYCQKGFLLTGYVVRECSPVGGCKFECFNTSSPLWNSKQNSYTGFVVTRENITVRCYNDTIADIHNFLQCNTGTVGIMPLCSAEDITLHPSELTHKAFLPSQVDDDEEQPTTIQLIVIITSSVAGCVIIVTTVLIICFCCRHYRQNTNRELSDDNKAVTNKSPPSDIERAINPGAEAVSNNVAFDNDDRPCQDSDATCNLPAIPDLAVRYDTLPIVDHYIDMRASSNHITSGPVVDSVGTVPDCNCDYDTINRAMQSVDGRPTDADPEYDHLHARVNPSKPSQDNYCHIKLTKGTILLDPEYSHVKDCKMGRGIEK